jgi:hypothetical protein
MIEQQKIELARQIINDPDVPKTSVTYTSAKKIVDASDAARLAAEAKSKQEKIESDRRRDEVAERWPSVAASGYTLDTDGSFSNGRYPRISVSGKDVDIESWESYESIPIDVIVAVLDRSQANSTANALMARIAELEELLVNKTQQAPTE